MVERLARDLFWRKIAKLAFEEFPPLGRRGARFIARAMPKSPSFARPWTDKYTFEGVTSPWTMPAGCPDGSRAQ